MSRYTLITVDLDDTLWPCAPAIMGAEQALYHWLRREALPVAAVHDIASLRRHRLWVGSRRPDIAHDLTALRLESLQLILHEFGCEPGLAEQGMALFLDHRNRVRPYADVSPALQLLGRGHRLVSVTNGNAAVERTPLQGLFHRSFTAAEVGATKPDPALFRAAMRWAAATPAATLHLGDDPLLDVAAARDLGMATVWVNRSGMAWPDTLAPPDLEVTDLNALPVWLESSE